MALRIAVLLAGLATLVLLAIPQLVIVGLFLIVPGIAMLVVPTLFAYLLVALGIRALLPARVGPRNTLVALLCAVVGGWAVMQPFRMIGRAAHEAEVRPDVVAATPPPLQGDVRLIWPDHTLGRDGQPACTALCLALLDLPGVTSVTLVDEQGDGATFALGGAGEPTFPVSPGDVVRDLPPFTADAASWSRMQLASGEPSRALAAQWALRLAQGPALTRAPARPERGTEWTIRFERRAERSKQRLHVSRVEIIDPAGMVRARRSLVASYIPATMFHLGFDLGSASNGFGGAHWHMGRQYLSTGEGRSDTFSGVQQTIQLAGIPKPVIAPDAPEHLRRATLATLEDPTPSAERLMIARLWLDTFRYDLGPSDLPVVARILEDPRIADPAEALDEALSSRLDLTVLRPGLAHRFLASEDPKTAGRYIAWLNALPEGTFAEPTLDERAIWNSVFSRQVGGPFVARMADQGSTAVPALLRMVDLAVARPWHERWQVLGGACAAFQHLGREGAEAIAPIRALLEPRASPLTNTSSDRDDWLLALARLGVPVEQLPFGEWVKPDELAGRVEKVRTQLERYERELERRRAPADGSPAP